MNPAETTCPTCHRYVTVANSVLLDGERRKRYYACPSCGWRPENNTVVVRVEFAPQRPSRWKIPRPVVAIDSSNTHYLVPPIPDNA
ncbi:MAG: hypothetical protein WD894_20245 [Pirellulales bacterium]